MVEKTQFALGDTVKSKHAKKSAIKRKPKTLKINVLSPIFFKCGFAPNTKLK